MLHHQRFELSGCPKAAVSWLEPTKIENFAWKKIKPRARNEVQLSIVQFYMCNFWTILDSLTERHLPAHKLAWKHLTHFGLRKEGRRILNIVHKFSPQYIPQTCEQRGLKRLNILQGMLLWLHAEKTLIVPNGSKVCNVVQQFMLSRAWPWGCHWAWPRLGSGKAGVEFGNLHAKKCCSEESEDSLVSNHYYLGTITGYHWWVSCNPE